MINEAVQCAVLSVIVAYLAARPESPERHSYIEAGATGICSVGLKDQRHDGICRAFITRRTEGVCSL